MPKIAFSDLGLKHLALPAKGQVEYWDEKLPAFGLRLSQGGARTFVLRRKNSRIVLGRYGVITLSEARIEAKRLLAEFTLGKVRPQRITFAQAAKLLVEEKRKARRASTADGYEWLLNRFSFTGSLTEITVSEITRSLSRIKSASTHDHALVALKILFSWAMKRRYVERDPTLGISLHGYRYRDRVLSPEELKAIWNACKLETSQQVQLEGGESVALFDKIVKSPVLPMPFANICKLLILTGQRRGEIAALHSSWMKDDTITLPATLTKNGRLHTFPLGGLAQSLLLKLSAFSSPALIFPARGKPSQPFNGWSKSKIALDQLSEVANWTLHDLRRTYRTIHAQIGTPPHIAERLVNHVTARSDMERVYDQYHYLPEMRKAVERYENHISHIIM